MTPICLQLSGKIHFNVYLGNALYPKKDENQLNDGKIILRMTSGAIHDKRPVARFKKK